MITAAFLIYLPSISVCEDNCKNNSNNTDNNDDNENDRTIIITIYQFINISDICCVNCHCLNPSPSLYLLLQSLLVMCYIISIYLQYLLQTIIIAFMIRNVTERVFSLCSKTCVTAPLSMGRIRADNKCHGVDGFFVQSRRAPANNVSASLCYPLLGVSISPPPLVKSNVYCGGRTRLEGNWRERRVEGKGRGEGNGGKVRK